MKKLTVFVCIFSFILLLTSCMNSKYARVVGDYDVSNLKGSFLTSNNEAYAIGKNSIGRPVFKDASKAWEAFIVDYADGIAAIQKEYNLQPISKDDYRLYLSCGIEMPEGLASIAENECKDVSYFLQIYSNSFR